MSGFPGALAGLLAAAAPLGALSSFAAFSRDAGRPARLRLAAMACVASFALLGVAALAGGTLLDLLDVSPENFQLAAGLVMIPGAFRLIAWGNAMTVRDEAAPRLAWLAPVAVPLIAGPASLAAALSYATRLGDGATIGAAAVTAALCGVVLLASPRIERLLGPPAVGSLARLNGAALMIAAAELMLDGLHSV